MATTTLQDVTLGIRGIGSRTNFAGGAVTDLTAEEDRFINKILSEGIIEPADSFKVVAGTAATMNVVVGSGAAKTDYYLVEGEDAGQGNYIVRMESATETFALTPANGSLARKDEVYIVVQDNAYDASARALPVLALRTGDAAASPTGPGPDAGWDASVLVATIDVPAAAADIVACTITDERQKATTTVPGPSLVKAYTGYVNSDNYVYQSDVGGDWIRHGYLPSVDKPEGAESWTVSVSGFVVVIPSISASQRIDMVYRLRLNGGAAGTQIVYIYWDWAGSGESYQVAALNGAVFSGLTADTVTIDIEGKPSAVWQNGDQLNITDGGIQALAFAS